MSYNEAFPQIHNVIISETISCFFRIGNGSLEVKRKMLGTSNYFDTLCKCSYTNNFEYFLRKSN